MRPELCRAFDKLGTSFVSADGQHPSTKQRPLQPHWLPKKRATFHYQGLRHEVP